MNQYSINRVVRYKPFDLIIYQFQPLVAALHRNQFGNPVNGNKDQNRNSQSCYLSFAPTKFFVQIKNCRKRKLWWISAPVSTSTLHFTCPLFSEQSNCKFQYCGCLGCYAEFLLKIHLQFLLGKAVARLNFNIKLKYPQYATPKYQII